MGNKLNKTQSDTAEEIYSSINEINSLSNELKNINHLLSNSDYNKTSLNLLDKRDFLLNELSKKIGIIVSLNTKGLAHITLENGFTLLDSKESYNLIYEKDNNQNIIISHLDNTKTQKEKIKINFNTISSGEIGGLISFYNYDIPILKEKINQNIFYFAKEFNKTNHEGYELNHELGKNIFSYKQFNSVKNGTPNDGDQFQISSAMNIAESIKLNLDNGNLISAANNNNSYNNNANVLKFIEIQNLKLFNNSTFTENYADFISYIGQITKNVQNVQDFQEKINNQLRLEYENKTGINLQEEYIYIELYRQYYYANVQLIKLASSLFESLLGAVSK
uniref:Flagellar hook-associated protein FlgK helical domain-containing protein n=1 Tax=Glossina pallidipes TaxID=7398 RepID=A0A1A9Z1H7_GLOPL